jgi:hypothetical protein
MIEGEPRISQITCSDCGLQTKIIVKQSGPENIIPVRAPNCRHPPVVQCPILKVAFMRAHAACRG